MSPLPDPEQPLAPTVSWFRDISLTDAPQFGGKGANLGELTQAGFPVPAGFVVSADGFIRAMAAGGVRSELREQTGALATTVSSEFEALAIRLQQLVHSAAVPPEIRAEIVGAYERLGTEPSGGHHNANEVVVAIRSSAAGEDSAETSFAGVNESFTNVHGLDEVVNRVIDCWASAFSPRALAYRASKQASGEVAVAVVVQRMVRVDRSGVAFSVDPTTQDPNRLMIEAAFGQGEVVVGGQVQPDTYLVDRSTSTVVETRLGHQAFEIVQGSKGADERIDLPPGRRGKRVLTDAEVLNIAALVERVATHYGVPQDVEFAIDHAGEVFLVQSRPITTLTRGDQASDVEVEVPAAPVLVSGLAAAPGFAIGQVRLLRDPTEGQALQNGEILVAPMTNPDWFPTIRRAGAVVTESGGTTCHAAIVSRELGVPAVVGAQNATTILTTGQTVTVDGTHGLVFAGHTPRAVAEPARPTTRSTTAMPLSEAEGSTVEPTGTLLYVNLAFSKKALEAARLPVDGVGLLRAEFMLTEALDGTHPRKLIAEGRSQEFVERLSKSVLEVTRRVRAATGHLPHHGFPHERVPLPRRWIRIRAEGGQPDDRLSRRLSISEGTGRLPSRARRSRPRPRTDTEPASDAPLRSDCLGARGLPRDDRPESIGSPTRSSPVDHGRGAVGHLPVGRLRRHGNRRCVDRIQRSDAVDARSGSRLGDLQRAVQRTRPAVLAAIEAIIKAAHAHGLTSSLCGQAPSNDPGFVEQLVRWGITSISVSPDVARHTREVIGAAEQRLLVEAARSRAGRLFVILVPRRVPIDKGTFAPDQRFSKGGGWPCEVHVPARPYRGDPGGGPLERLRRRRADRVDACCVRAPRTGAKLRGGELLVGRSGGGAGLLRVTPCS